MNTPPQTQPAPDDAYAALDRLWLLLQGLRATYGALYALPEVPDISETDRKHVADFYETEINSLIARIDVRCALIRKRGMLCSLSVQSCCRPPLLWPLSRS